MGQGRTTSLTLRLTPAERRTLLAWQRATTTISAGRARRGPDSLTRGRWGPGRPCGHDGRHQPSLCLQVGAAVSGKRHRGIDRQTWPRLLAPVAPACLDRAARGQRLKRLPDAVSTEEGDTCSAERSSALRVLFCTSRSTIAFRACTLLPAPQRDEGGCPWLSRVQRTRSLTGSSHSTVTPLQ